MENSGHGRSRFRTLLSIISSLGLAMALEGGAAIAAPPSSGPPAIRIISPVNDQIVHLGDIAVQVATENFPLEGSNVWLLSVDGTPVGKVTNGATRTTASIMSSGPHELKVSLADAERADIASASVYVTAAPATPRESPFNLPWMAAAMGILVVAIVGLIALGLRTKPRRR